MADVWFVGLAVLGVVTLGGTALVFWLARIAAQQREEKDLTAADLLMLRESVEALIERLKCATDEAVAEIEVRQRSLEVLLERVDRKVGEGAIRPEAGEVYRLVEEGIGEAEIARRAGLTRGEVELMLEVAATRR